MGARTLETLVTQGLLPQSHAINFVLLLINDPCQRHHNGRSFPGRERCSGGCGFDAFGMLAAAQPLR